METIIVYHIRSLFKGVYKGLQGHIGVMAGFHDHGETSNKRTLTATQFLSADITRLGNLQFMQTMHGFKIGCDS